MLCLKSASLSLYVLQMKHISRNMARDIHNALFYIISIFCKSAISLKGLGKLGLLINEAPRQVSDLLDLAVLLSRACRLGCGTERVQQESLWSQQNHELLSKWWRALTEAADWLALKVYSRNSNKFKENAKSTTGDRASIFILHKYQEKYMLYD